MSYDSVKDSRQQILTAFDQLLQQYNRELGKIATKEEEIEKEKNKGVLERASDYTVDSIVNSMASLQLEFGRIIDEVSQTLTTESSKLDELKKAIAVKKEQLEQLQQVRLVADALYLLRQQHQERTRSLQKQIDDQREALEKEKIEKRKLWQKEQEEFETKIAEEAALRLKQREREASDYQYQLERDQRVEMDQYEEAKRQQEWELQQMNKEKEKGWQEREAVLETNQSKHQENLQKIETYESKLKEEYNKAKGEAIKDAERKAKVQADLLEKDWELSQQGYELKTQSLEATIQRNNEQIADLIAQLQTATSQSQNLALRAFQSSDEAS
ncbi:MAG: hypothetical protein AB4058_20335 [Microcystaceae cyanobacterium]